MTPLEILHYHAKESEHFAGSLDREIYICKEHMYRTPVIKIINIYTADKFHAGQTEYCLSQQHNCCGENQTKHIYFNNYLT